MQWNPYISFNGQCEAAFKFYERCLGGKIVAMVPYGDMPAGDPAGCGEMPAEIKNKIMHARLMAGNQILMGSDAPPGRPSEGMKGCSVAVQVSTPEEAEKLFSALSEKGTVMMPIAETFWAIRFGMLTDQFGVPWMINCERPR